MRQADLTNPDQQCRSLGGDAALPTGGRGGTDSYLKARTALTVYQAQERRLAIPKKKGTMIDRAQPEALMFRSARQESNVQVTRHVQVTALMAGQAAADLEQSSGKPLVIEATTMQRVLDARVWVQLEGLADLSALLGQVIQVLAKGATE